MWGGDVKGGPRPDKSGLAMTDEDFTLTLPSPLKGEGEEEW